MSGVNFGASLDTTPTSRLGLSDCGTTSWASATSVVCFLTRGDGVEHTGTITAVSVVGTRTSTFSYDGPFPRIRLLHLSCFALREDCAGCSLFSYGIDSGFAFGGVCV